MRRKTLFYLFIGVLSGIFILYQCKSTSTTQQTLYPKEIIQLSDEKASTLAKQIRKEVAAKVIDGLELSLWASDSLVVDPVAISIDPQGGIYYTQGTRLENSEFDIRGHRDWMTSSISFESVEDRRAFLRKTLSPENSEENKKFLEDLNEDGSHDWKDLLIEKEMVWRVSDETGDGIADQSQLYIEDFNEEITDLANGVEYHDGDVYIAVGPDFWKTTDTDGDGIADTKESLSHGWAVHIGFGAHGMSGAIMGPQGRIWWGIGDIGMNVTDKEGKRWKYPNQGVIVRCEPDGSNFEVFARGLRNTHEFVFDKFGNLISEDNDGDHKGERERLVYITNGSDGGWRTNWQFGKYTDPKNNTYKVWMDEKLNVPRWKGQAAYITPPIINYVNGPTGMVYNPGTALGQEWYDHFFIAEFRGSPANSPIHAFTLKPKGASFELEDTKEVASGLLPTGLDWGPDGALYFGDWIDGWGVKEEGRIWKLDVPNGAASQLRQDTKELLQEDFSEYSVETVSSRLYHQDMRVRQKAQFELVKRGEEGAMELLAIAKRSSSMPTNQLGRIHAIWGISQYARKEATYGKELVPFLTDQDPEIQAQAAKMIGDVRYKGATQELLPLLKHPSLRVQFFAAEALGRTEAKEGIQPIMDMLEANNDEDAWLRHAGILALARIGEAAPLIALKDHPSKALRIAGVVALRRLNNPAIAEFLKDKDEYIVTEAARGINDDWSIPDALPALAEVLKTTSFKGEPLIRRAINANLRVGNLTNIQALVDYANNKAAPEAMRAEAIATVSNWVDPSPLDRVDGRNRRFIRRGIGPPKKAIEPSIASLLKDSKSSVQQAAIQAVGQLNLTNFAPSLFDLLRSAKQSSVRQAALEGLSTLKYDQLSQATEIALADKSNEVRSAALGLLTDAAIPEEKAVQLFTDILKSGSVQEKQATFAALGKLKSTAAISLLSTHLTSLIAGKSEAATSLDLIEAIEENGTASLTQQLKIYQSQKDKNDPLADYREVLAGGNKENGRGIFYWNEAAQCGRCHAIFEWGGDAGPVLHGIASKRSPEYLLESLIEPSAKLADGYGVATLTLEDGETLAGIIQSENEESITLKMGKDEAREIFKTNIKEREDVPSSMPGVKDVLTKKEIRDVLAFLLSLTDVES